MTSIHHDAVLVTVNGDLTQLATVETAVTAFRDSLPEEWRRLVIGPVRSAINNYATYLAFLADGSKLGWDLDLAGDTHRERFVDLFAGHRADIVGVTYGLEHREEDGAPVAEDLSNLAEFREENTCDMCGDDLSDGSSHYHCPECGQLCGMMGHDHARQPKVLVRYGDRGERQVFQNSGGNITIMSGVWTTIGGPA